MKAKIKLSPPCDEAMKKEIKRQILEHEAQYIDDIEAMILWTLHAEFGFGKSRLERFYKAFGREYESLKEKYEMDDCFPEEYNLKKIGVDLDELRKG